MALTPLVPQKITALASATTPLDGTGVIYLVQAGNSRKTTVADLRRLPSYTVATKPSASTSGAGALIFLSDGVGNKKVAVSDGSAWYYMEGTAV